MSALLDVLLADEHRAAEVAPAEPAPFPPVHLTDEQVAAVDDTAGIEQRTAEAR